MSWLTAIGRVGWFSAWVAITTIALFLHPDPSGHGTHRQMGLPPCPSVLFFGKLCPGCGLTTSFTATVHGDLATAFHSHPLGPPLYAFFTMTALASLAGFLRKRNIFTGTKAFNGILSVMVVLFLAHGIWRFITGPRLPDSDRFPFLVLGEKGR